MHVLSQYWKARVLLCTCAIPCSSKALMHWERADWMSGLRTFKAAMRTSPWVGLTSPEALESLSSKFCRTAAAAASSRSFASILLTPSTYRRESPHTGEERHV